MKTLVFGKAGSSGLVGRCLSLNPRYDFKEQAITRRTELLIKPGVTAADWDFEVPHHEPDITPDGKLLCVAGRASDYVGLISTDILQPVALIDVGDAPGWAAVNSDGRYCLEPNTRSDDVSVISIAKRSEVARLRVGRGSKHIRFGRMPESILASFAATAPPAAP